MVFENTGTATSPEFTLRADHPIAALSFPEGYNGISLGFVDLDQDGDNDFFVGVNGQFEYYVNDNPAPSTTVNSTTLDYEFNTGPFTVDATLTLADTDGDLIVRATVAIQNFQAGDEALSFTSQNPITGSFDATTGILTLQGIAPVSLYQSVLRTVTYNYTGADPGPVGSGGRAKSLNRTIAFNVFDEDLTTPGVAARTITISSPPVAPPPPPPAEEIIVYNGMSPNGDQLNQFFNIENIEDLGPENKVSIFNRWGDKVFEINNYNNDERRFEGRSDDGKELSSGVYFYRIQFSNGLPELKGYLTLKR